MIPVPLFIRARWTLTTRAGAQPGAASRSTPRTAQPATQRPMEADLERSEREFRRVLFLGRFFAFFGEPMLRNAT